LGVCWGRRASGRLVCERGGTRASEEESGARASAPPPPPTKKNKRPHLVEHLLHVLLAELEDVGVRGRGGAAHACALMTLLRLGLDWGNRGVA
jgi:hypothetical protein